MPIAPVDVAVPAAVQASAPIVITGRALPDPRSEQAFNVELITHEELVNDPSKRLDSILRRIAGFQLFRRSDSTSGHPTSQGVTLRALGGTASSRALLILDGVSQSDPFGGWVNWPAFDPASLAEVRVVRGGGSIAYGPGALAGVIEMSSFSDEGADASIEAGSRRSIDGHFYIGAPLAAGRFTLSGQAGSSHGFIPLTESTRGLVDRASPYREAKARARWIVPVNGDADLQLSALGFFDRRDRGVAFTANRTAGGDASLRLVGKGRWQWSAAAYAQLRNLRSSFASVNDERTEASRVSLQDSVPSDAIGGSVELRPPMGRGIEFRTGADARFSSGRSRELYAYVEGDPTRRRVSGGRSQTLGMFAEASWTGTALTLSAGARIDHWRISDGKLAERLVATGDLTRDDHFPSRSGWRPTARAGAILGLGPNFSVRSAAYLGWRLPTLNELFRPFRVGSDATAANPLLDPERLKGAEVGLDFRRGPTRVALTAFDNRLDDAIGNVTLGHGPGQFPGVGFVAGDYRQRRNLGSVHVRGLEASASTSSGSWSFRAEASLVDPRVHSDGNAAALNGLRPAQTPKVALSAELGWNRKGRAVALSVLHVGPQFEDDLNQRRLPGATTFGAFAAWPVGKNLTLIGRVENLFDARFVAGKGNDGTVERALPRTIWIGIRI